MWINDMTMLHASGLVQNMPLNFFCQKNKTSMEDTALFGSSSVQGTSSPNPQFKKLKQFELRLWQDVLGGRRQPLSSIAETVAEKKLRLLYLN